MLDVVAASTRADISDLADLSLSDRVWAANAPAALLLIQLGINHDLLPAPSLDQLAMVQKNLSELYGVEVGNDGLLNQSCSSHAIWKTQQWEWRRQQLERERQEGSEIRLILLSPVTLPGTWAALGQSLNLEIISV